MQLGTHSTSLSRLVLTSAARVMLIDDPIAHVDDLNSLSFLDYLREIAIRATGNLATANDKIATLF